MSAQPVAAMARTLEHLIRRRLALLGTGFEIPVDSALVIGTDDPPVRRRILY